MYAKDEDSINEINAETAQETFDPLEPLTEEDLQANNVVY